MTGSDPAEISRLDPRGWSTLAWARVVYLSIGIPAVYLLDDPWQSVVTLSAILGLATFDVSWRRRQSRASLD